MKYFVAKLPKYFELLVGISLAVIVVQYALITGVVKPGHLVSGLLQLCFYLLLAVSVFRGVIQHSRFAWLVVQMMLTALFSFSLLFAVVCAALALKGGSFWFLLFTVLLTSVVNGLLIGFLFSLPVCDYFSPRDDDQ
jgi:hypothetical protein